MEGHVYRALSEGHACRARESGMDYQTWCGGPDKQVPPRDGPDKRVPPNGGKITRLPQTRRRPVRSSWWETCLFGGDSLSLMINWTTEFFDVPTGICTAPDLGMDERSRNKTYDLHQVDKPYGDTNFVGLLVDLGNCRGGSDVAASGGTRYFRR